MDLAPDLLLLVMAAAFLAGVIDAVSGGGGLLTLPALLASGVPPVAALATNKLQSSFGTAGTVFAYMRRGHIDVRRMAWPTLASFAGSAGGALAVTMIDPAFLRGLLPLLLIAIAIYVLAAPRMSEIDRHARAGPAWLLVAAGVIGAYDGFFGPGAGSFFTLTLVTIFGFGIIRAVAQTKLLNLASNLAALAVMAAGGHVLWAMGMAMAAANIAGGQIGARLVMRFGGSVVRPVLIVVSLALTARLLADPENPLTLAARRLLA